MGDGKHRRPPHKPGQRSERGDSLSSERGKKKQDRASFIKKGGRSAACWKKENFNTREKKEPLRKEKGKRCSPREGVGCVRTDRKNDVFLPERGKRDVLRNEKALLCEKGRGNIHGKKNEPAHFVEQAAAAEQAGLGRKKKKGTRCPCCSPEEKGRTGIERRKKGGIASPLLGKLSSGGIAQ